MTDKDKVSNANGHEPQNSELIVHGKPSLNVTEQIAQLKSQGVTFNVQSEKDAANYLQYENSYFRTRSYRKLYPRHSDGTYINLDFAALSGLSSLDRQLRSVFLDACIDVEHFAKMKLLRVAQEHNEDGYAVISDFLSSLNHRERDRFLSRIRVRTQADRRDEYTGDLIEHYMEDMPIWVLIEVLDFGQFINFYLYCSQRWSDIEMRQEHYALKSCKALRNACAHNVVIIPGLSSDREQAGYQTNPLIADSLNSHGIRNSKSRRAKLSNLRIEEMAATLFCLSRFAGQARSLEHCAEALQALRCSYVALKGLLPADGSLTSYFEFLWKLVDIWLPQRV